MHNCICRYDVQVYMIVAVGAHVDLYFDLYVDSHIDKHVNSYLAVDLDVQVGVMYIEMQDIGYM